jgi:hypothetical protein
MQHVENPSDRFHMNQKSYPTIISLRKIFFIRIVRPNTSSHAYTNPRQAYIELWEILTRLRSDISLCKQTPDSCGVKTFPHFLTGWNARLEGSSQLSTLDLDVDTLGAVVTAVKATKVPSKKLVVVDCRSGFTSGEVAIFLGLDSPNVLHLDYCDTNII